MTQFLATVADTFRVASTTGIFGRVPAEAADLVVVSQVSKRQWRASAVLHEAIAFAAKLRSVDVYTLTLAETAKFRVAVRVLLPAVLRSGFRVRTFLTVAQGVTLRDAVKVRAAGRAQALYRKTLASRTRITDRLPTMKLGGLLRDLVRYAEDVFGLRRTIAQAHDEVEVGDALGHVLQLTVITGDSVELTDDTLLLAIYNGVLSDKVDFVLDVVDPSGDITTWAMNVRTGAVTEYMNFGFNSYAKGAAGTYLAAGDDGLYELTGDDDDGVPIATDLVGGLIDFSGPFLSSLQAAYIAMRGNGDVYLKLTEASGRKSVLYKVTTRSLRTSRVNIGKGLRATYFTWELVTVGQDFDLLSLDFLPVQQTRRI